MKICLLIILMKTGVQIILAELAPASPDPPMGCAMLQRAECSQLGYNMTYIPNFRGHENQEQASKEFNDFFPLVTQRCSNAILHFLCSFYFPVCFVSLSSPQAMRFKPCRRLCEYVQPSCSGLFEDSNFSWPSFFNCSIENSFSDDNTFCFGQDNLSDITLPISDETPTSSRTIATSASFVTLFGAILMYTYI